MARTHREKAKRLELQAQLAELTDKIRSFEKKAANAKTQPTKLRAEAQAEMLKAEARAIKRRLTGRRTRRQRGLLGLGVMGL